MNRNVILGILFTFVLGLGGFAVYLGVQLSSPTSTGNIANPNTGGNTQFASQNLNCTTICNDANNTSFSDPNPSTFATCGEWAIKACETVNATPVGNNSNTNFCFVDNPSVTDSFIKFEGCASSVPVTVRVHIEPAGDRDSAADCVGTTSASPRSKTLSAGATYRVSDAAAEFGATCGQCVQIDANIAGRDYGSAMFTGTCNTPVTPTTPNTPTPQTPTTSYSCTNGFQCVVRNDGSGTFPTLQSCSLACLPPVSIPSGTLPSTAIFDFGGKYQPLVIGLFLLSLSMLLFVLKDSPYMISAILFVDKYTFNLIPLNKKLQMRENARITKERQRAKLKVGRDSFEKRFN